MKRYNKIFVKYNFCDILLAKLPQLAVGTAIYVCNKYLHLISFSRRLVSCRCFVVLLLLLYSLKNHSVKTGIGDSFD